MITLSGERLEFESILQAEFLKIPRPTIYRSIKSGNPISKGKCKGCSFKLIDSEEPVVKIKSDKIMNIDKKTHLYKRLKEIEQDDSDNADLEYAEPESYSDFEDISQVSREKQSEQKRAVAFQQHKF